MLVGYMRVSTADQNLGLQRDALVAAGISPDQIYEDVCSGRAIERPGIFGAELRHAVVASPAYLAEGETPTSPDDLSRHRCIQWRPNGSDTQAWQFECDGQPKTIAVSGPLVVSHCGAAITAALQGLRPRVLLAPLYGQRAADPAAVPVSSALRWVEGLLCEEHSPVPRRARRRGGSHDDRTVAMPRIETAASAHARRGPGAYRTAGRIPW